MAFADAGPDVALGGATVELAIADPAGGAAETLGTPGGSEGPRERSTLGVPGAEQDAITTTPIAIATRGRRMA
jgi:hypothetical protein